MINNNKKKYNNSSSLGRTQARRQQHQLSSLPQPKEFDIDIYSLNQFSNNIKNIEKELRIITPKLTPTKSRTENGSVLESYMRIQLNRQRCSKMGEEVHTATMDKNLRVNKMYQQLHHFSICVDELKWLLHEGDNILRAYLAQATLISPQSFHTKDVTNLSQEFRSLVLRFAQIDKGQLRRIEEEIKSGQVKKMQNWLSNEFYREQRSDNPERKQLPIFQSIPLISSNESVKYSRNKPFFDTMHFSVPLKENINTANLPNFDNIQIIKSQSTKMKSTQRNQQAYNTNQSIKQIEETNSKYKEELSNQKRVFQLKLKQQYEEYEELSRRNEILKDQVDSFERKFSKYKVCSSKSIQKLAEILKNLMSNPTQRQKDLQLLKMAQTISNWEKMINDERQEAKYRDIYGNLDTLKQQKTQKLEEIIILQFDINHLLAQRDHLQKNMPIQEGNIKENQDIYRMLVAQACVLEQLCNF